MKVNRSIATHCSVSGTHANAIGRATRKIGSLRATTALVPVFAAALSVEAATQELIVEHAAQEIHDHFSDPANATYSLHDVGGISGDGSVVVGTVQRNTGILSGFVWTQADGFRPVGDLAGTPLQVTYSFTATGVSADGQTIVGTAGYDLFQAASPTVGVRAYRWTAADGFVDLGSLGNNQSVANGVSGDGAVVFGQALDTANGNHVSAMRWTAGTGMVSLGALSGELQATALAASHDGAVIVGNSTNGSTFQSNAFVWTTGGGMTALPMLPSGIYSTARAVSYDGTVIAGSASGSDFSIKAVRWVDGEISLLGGLNGSGGASEAIGISGDGLVIVGRAQNVADSFNYRAFRWTEDDGMQSVEDWLRANGATIAADITDRAKATNADGSVVLGVTTDNKMFIARVSGGGSGGEGGESGGDTGDDPGENDGDDGGGGSDGGESGGEGGGTGIITFDDLQASLAGSGVANAAVVNGLGTIVNGAGSRPLDRLAGEDRSVLWLGGDWGRDDHGSRDGSIGIGEMGLGHNFGQLQVNGVLGLSGLTQHSLLGGRTEVDSTYAKIEVLARLLPTNSGGLWGVFGATGLWGAADIRRNYLDNGGLTDSSFGRTDVDGYNLRGRLQLENLAAHLSPYVELSHARTCLDAYSEAGGAFPSAFDKLCDEATEARVGFDANVPLTETFRLVGTLEGVHRFQNHGNNITGQVIGLGAFSLGAVDHHQDWLRGGVGFETDIAGSKFAVTANATTKGESADLWVAANWRLTF